MANGLTPRDAFVTLPLTRGDVVEVPDGELSATP
jgi:hypothetical protein